MSARIRALVVEDSLTVRRRLVEVLANDPAIEVVGEADNGVRAIELCRSLQPDVITLDIVMPAMDGLQVTEHIMAFFPRPIVVVSAASNRGELFDSFKALKYGAVEVVEKPSVHGGDDERWERQLVTTVKLASKIKVITHLKAKLTPMPQRLDLPHLGSGETLPELRRQSDGLRAIVIGASTGGPQALSEILSRLPRNYPLPILVVLHIGEPFGEAFAEWLNGLCALPVRLARDGEPLPPVGEGQVLVAVPEKHLILKRGRLRFTLGPERNSVRPAADELFESAARELGKSVAGIVLTGMGRDGAEGLLAIRRAGGCTFAQDEATSVIFGMPQEAIRLGAAEHVLSLPAFAPMLLRLGEQVMAKADPKRGRKP